MKRIIILLLLTLTFKPVDAQVPQGFNYQAVATDGTGAQIRNTTLQVKIAILSDLVPGTVKWEELHSSVLTNANGLFNLVVGSGVRQAGVSAFSDIDWTSTPLYLKTQIYYQSEWKDMGSTQLYTVPYAMVADDLSGTLKKLAVTGETTSMEEALFEVKNKDGQTIFAVYNEGVRVYVSDGDAKGVKGGFAIGGFDNTKGTIQEYFVVNSDSIRAYIDDNGTGKGVKGGFAIGGFDDTKALTQNYLKVSPDSIRLYVDNNPSIKGVKGGFAIGGFDNTKGTKQDLLTVSSDSTRIYVDNTPLTKGVKGGFAIGGFDDTKGNVTPFTSLTPENYFIGHQAGNSNRGGLYNSFLGYMAGFSNTEGSRNIFVGHISGQKNTIGYNNIMLGDSSGFANTSGYFNVFIGSASGKSNISGYQNSFVGYLSGKSNTTGYRNTFLGTYAGYSSTTGWRNTFVGNVAGTEIIEGNDNTFIGNAAGWIIKHGDGNTILGFNSASTADFLTDCIIIGQAGVVSKNGTRNIFIGYSSGDGAKDGSDNIFLGSSSGLFSKSNRSICIGYESGMGMQSFTSAENVFIGSGTGKEITSGYDNVSIGSNSGSWIGTGSGNAFFGARAGSNNINQSLNTFIGSDAGYNNFLGTQNIFLGNGAGYYETGSNKLFIDNQTRTSESDARVKALIYGIFDADPANQILTINGKLGVGTTTPNYNLDVIGTIGSNTTLYHSDERWKTDISPIKYGLNEILELNSVSYSWNISDYPKMSFNDGSQLGFIAQEFEKVIPELVSTDNDGYKSIDYVKLTPVLVEAIKEQQNQIENQQKEIDELKALVNSLVNQNVLSSK